MSTSLCDHDLEPPSLDAENDVQSSDHDSSDEESDTENFRPVIDAIDLNALASAAIEARKKSDRQKSTTAASTILENLTCVIQTPPLIGSFNLAYVILFSDNVKWIARIPGSGVSKFGQLEAQRLLTDIRTTTFVRSRTSIPIPEVFAWELSQDNPVRVPYHLETFIEGKPLAERWATQLSENEPARMKILRSLAKVMSQLHAFQFDAIGSLVFESDNTSPHVGATVLIGSSYDEMFFGGEVWGTASLCGPYKSTKEYLLDMLDDPKEVPKKQEKYKAVIALVRQAINSIPPFLDTTQTFSLGHPDFNYQNIFTNEEGDITGIIDWDGIRTYPRALGFAGYPSWITRDWDPVRYGYDMPDCRDEDSPAQLLSYRREYAATMAGLQLPEESYATHDTTLSQLLEAVAIATDDEMCQPLIIKKLLEFAFNGNVPFDFHEFIDAWLLNEAGDWMEKVKHAFGLMWHEE